MLSNVVRSYFVVIAPRRLIDQYSVLLPRRRAHFGSRLTHLVEPLHSDRLAHEEDGQGNQDQSTKDCSNDASRVPAFIFINVSLVELERTFVTSGDLGPEFCLLEGHSVRVVFFGFHTSVCNSGLFGLDCDDLSIDVLLDLVGLFLAEHVDGTWNDLVNASEDVGLDDFLIDRDLFPLSLTIDGSLDVVICRSDLIDRCRNDVLESGEFSDVVASNLAFGEL